MKHLSNNNDSTSNHDEIRAQFTSWINVVVWRARRDYFKSQQRHFREIPIEEIDEIPDNSSFEVLEKDEFIFADERLAKAFPKLPLCQQQVITLRIAKDLSPAEIAEIMGCDSARISRQYYKAIAKLRSIMTQKCGPYDFG